MHIYKYVFYVVSASYYIFPEIIRPFHEILSVILGKKSLRTFSKLITVKTEIQKIQTGSTELHTYTSTIHVPTIVFTRKLKL
jgi:hypothetical protein